MPAVVLASAGSPDTTLIRVGGNGTLDGGTDLRGQPSYSFDTAIFMEVDSAVGGRCVARLIRPNASTPPFEQTVQLDADPGEVARVRIPLGSVVLSTDPTSPNYVRVGLDWVSQVRQLQLSVVEDRIRQALTYTRSRLLQFPSNQRMNVATWQTISDELAAQVAQKVVGGTIEVG